jgi:hypothetical protein
MQDMSVFAASKLYVPRKRDAPPCSSNTRTRGCITHAHNEGPSMYREREETVGDYAAALASSAAGASAVSLVSPSAGAADSALGSVSDEVQSVYVTSQSTSHSRQVMLLLTKLSRRSCMMRVESL